MRDRTGIGLLIIEEINEPETGNENETIVQICCSKIDSILDVSACQLLEQ